MPSYTDDQVTVYINYTNWKGETNWRRIIPSVIYFDTNQWHPEPQWILLAKDLDKGEFREFSLANIHEWRATPPLLNSPANSEGGEQ